MTSKKTVLGKHRVTVTIEPEDYKLVRMAAAYENLSPNEYMRLVSVRDARELLANVDRG